MMKLATSRPFDVFYRRSGQAMNLGSHDQLFSEDFGSSGYSTKRDTPELEVKPGGPPRKRVPVAVSQKYTLVKSIADEDPSATGVGNVRSNAAATKVMGVGATTAKVQAGRAANFSECDHQYLM
ncbi:hypothetical protein OHC33_008197 [Knufia fluminis]|uniref:Uncharacterized protein n=1 Tax=Knufia fluminis TaxID=191047 RepID=A0AAN8EAR6_9EURO|nr:hypothetical protein OHC33_008197 [Knufia fluminis]